MGNPNCDESLKCLKEHASKYYPNTTVDEILAGCLEQRATTLRANGLKSNIEAIKAKLDSLGLSHEEVPWYKDALVLAPNSEELIQAEDFYSAGELYLQNLSAMIPVLVLDPKACEDICDLCAAPGGKTTQIASMTNGSCFITACERSNPRAEKLAFNLDRQGVKNATILRQDARELDDFFSFDRVLLDAPCSGSGTLVAANPKTLKDFSNARVDKSAALQKSLLTKALNMVRPGGTVVYATCSILKCENEHVIKAVLQPENPSRGNDDSADCYWEIGEPLKIRNSKSSARYKLEPIDIPAIEFLPLLENELPETLTIKPTNLYEGFFVAKIKRTA